MGSPIDVGGQYPFITLFTPPRLSGKFLLWCDEQVTHEADIRTDLSFWWYDRRTVDATDIRTDVSCWWYDRRTVDATDIRTDTSP